SASAFNQAASQPAALPRLPPCALHLTKQNPRDKMIRGFIKVRFP
ncbi:hypothetical protein HMPREF0542_11278, partial [Ligilactobacillus ruminis ATCC 25644]